MGSRVTSHLEHPLTGPVQFIVNPPNNPGDRHCHSFLVTRKRRLRVLSKCTQLNDEFQKPNASTDPKACALRDWQTGRKLIPT